MEIGIIGSGALGLLYSFYLSKTNSVTLYTNREQQASKINEERVTLVKGNAKYEAVIYATPENNYRESLLIVTVKQYQLQPIIDSLKKQSPKTIVFLQNGMGHIKHLTSLSHHQIILGVSEHGALRVDDHIVHHTGMGVTKVSSFNNNEPEKIKQLISHRQPAFPFIEMTNWESMLKEKLIVNATINPLTALFRVRNGELLRNPYFKKIFYQLFEEIVWVLDIDEKETLWEHVTKICENTAENTSSMYKDILNQKQTEVDSILGYLIERADSKSIPYLSFIYDAIKGVEDC